MRVALFAQWGFLAALLAIVPHQGVASGDSKGSDMPPDIRALEQEVLAHRRAIKTGHVEVLSRTWDVSKAGKRLRYERGASLWFDDAKIRQDVLIPHKPVNAEAPTHSYHERTVWTEEDMFFWSDQVIPRSTGITASWFAKKAVSKPIDYAVADPRLIGMVAMNYPNLIHYQLNSELGRTDRDVPSIRAEMYDGLECWRVEHTRVNGAVTRLWIAPSQGYSVVRIETEFTDGEHRIIDSVHCRLVNYNEQGLWFPKESHYERSIDGELVEMEGCELTVHHLNLPVEKSTFALAGLGIPAGTPVTRIPSDVRGSLVWNGHEAVPRSLVSAPEVLAGWWRASLGLASAALALLAALAVVVYSRRRLRPVQSA